MGLAGERRVDCCSGIIAVWFLVRPCRVAWHPWDAEQRARLAGMGVLLPSGIGGVVWGEAERAAIPFRRAGRVLLAFGDPVGAATDRISAIWRLRDLARQEGLDPAVWRAGPDLLKGVRRSGIDGASIGAGRAAGTRSTR